MEESEVHSLISEKTEEIEDERLRSFINEVLLHERNNLRDKRAEYSERYMSLVEGYADNQSLEDFTDE